MSVYQTAVGNTARELWSGLSEYAAPHGRMDSIGADEGIDRDAPVVGEVHDHSIPVIGEVS
jgi:hypothetical protein